MPQRLLRLAGARLHPLSGRYVAPSEPTIRRLAHTIDADAADAQVGAWLRGQAHAGSSHTAGRVDPGGAG